MGIRQRLNTKHGGMNMKTTINKPVEVEVKFLKVDATVRYWQDSDINGTEDCDCEEETNEPQMPCAKYIGEQNRTLRAYDWHWKPIIDIDNGRIINWTDGITASIHYKVCDEFSCDLIVSIQQTPYCETC